MWDSPTSDRTIKIYMFKYIFEVSTYQLKFSDWIVSDYGGFYIR